MTVYTTPGWLQNAGAVHSAQQMRNYAGSMLLAGAGGATTMQPRGGVHPTLGNRFQVTQTGSPSMAVIVKSGLCAIPGTEAVTQGTYGLGNDGDVTLSIAAAHATLPRIDIVIGRIRDTAYSGGVNSGVLEVVTGTAASSPVAPATPANSLVYAQVAVAAAVTSISNGNITDARTYLAGSGGVIPALSTNSFANLLHAGQPVYETDTGRLKITTDTGSTFKTIFTNVNVQYFTSSGTWNKPSGASRVLVEVLGAGGGGGGALATAANASACGGGGGAGGYAMKWFDASSLGASESVTVGAGGSTGSGATGGAGGTSSFNTLSATGGGGGTASSSTTASGTTLTGAGGVGSGGDLNITGQGGGWGKRSSSGNGVGVGGGMGGSSMFGSGAPGRGGTAGADGLASGNYGGGGGGAANEASQGARVGGAAGGGLVVVTSFM